MKLSDAQYKMMRRLAPKKFGGKGQVLRWPGMTGFWKIHGRSHGQCLGKANESTMLSLERRGLIHWLRTDLHGPCATLSASGVMAWQKRPPRWRAERRKAE